MHSPDKLHLTRMATWLRGCTQTLDLARIQGEYMGVPSLLVVLCSKGKRKAKFMERNTSICWADCYMQSCTLYAIPVHTVSQDGSGRKGPQEVSGSMSCSKQYHL